MLHTAAKVILVKCHVTPCSQPSEGFPSTYRIDSNSVMAIGAQQELAPTPSPTSPLQLPQSLQPHWPSFHTLSLPGSGPLPLPFVSPRMLFPQLIPPFHSGLLKCQLSKVPNHTIENRPSPFQHFIFPYAALFFFVEPEIIHCLFQLQWT